MYLLCGYFELRKRPEVLHFHFGFGSVYLIEYKYFFL